MGGVRYTPYYIYVDNNVIMNYELTTIYDKDRLYKEYRKKYPNKKVEILTLQSHYKRQGYKPSRFE